QLEHQRKQAVHRNAGVADAVWRRGRRGQNACELFGRNDPERDQMIAKPPSALALPLQAALDIGRFDQSMRNKDVAEMHLGSDPPSRDRSRKKSRGLVSRPLPSAFWTSPKLPSRGLGLD